MSHVAMQIAYPALYWDYYEGEHVWTYSHPKMQELLKLCMSCLTDNRHPSDYYGEHEFVDEDAPKKLKPAKVINSAHKNWVKACQERKKDISVAWATYMDTCNKRKTLAGNWELWREEQLGPLQEQIDEIMMQYDTGIEDLAKTVADAFKKHADLKNAPKPQITEYK